MVLLGVVAILNIWMITQTSGHIYTSESVPEHDVGLVLGTSKRLTDGSGNPYFSNRIKTASTLYHTGKVRHLIVSGDNRTRYYNEPQDMLDALLETGIPQAAITLDYAGLRTLDSVVRCKEIFGQDTVTVITQRFHAHRAIFIGKKYDIYTDAVAAKSMDFPHSLRVQFREFFARPLTFVDLYIFQTKPRHLGEPEKIDLVN